MMTTKIGSVTLDLSKYPGEDFYCDGAVEDEILEIVSTCTREQYQEKIEEKKSWEVFYHLSPQRENIISWLPFDKDTKVLEVGSGMGAITGAIARKAGRVDCVDLSKKRSTINALRNKDLDNVTIHVGNFNDIEPELDCDYDYVLLIGVFEYGGSYIPGDHPYEDFLNINLRHVKKDGHLVIAIENKMGMKYWAGCQEDHLAGFFVGIEDYPGSRFRTFTRGGLEKLLKGSGVEEYSFYYPYPDYKFPTTLYSDERLPLVGELSNNLRNFDRDRLLLFNEKNAFDMVIREGLFPLYSNSYMLITGPKIDTVFTKYSNDRASEYMIRTDILEGGQGRFVRKCALSEAAAAHVEALPHLEELLRKRYSEAGLSINHCVADSGIQKDTGANAEVILQYLEGRTLEELLDERLAAADQEGFDALVDTYYEKISANSCAGISDRDLIFANIMVSDQGQWTLIDYEWAVEEALDPAEQTFRALYCYKLAGGKRRSGLDLSGYAEKLGLSEAYAAGQGKRERDFQLMVTGNRVSMSDMRELLGRRAASVDGLFDMMSANTMEIFEDLGQGYSPEHSYRIYPSYLVKDKRKASLQLKKGMVGLRIDPAEWSCMVRMDACRLNEVPLNLADRSVFSVNGVEMSEPGEPRPVFLFKGNDPNLNVRFGQPLQEDCTLEISFDCVAVADDTLQMMIDRCMPRKNKMNPFSLRRRG